MPRCTRTFVLLAVVLSPCLAAQAGPPGPAPELKRLEPLLGSWAGSGTAKLGPGEPSKWTARGSYRWCLDGQFLQEDFEIVFEGRPAPMVFRAYLGWDREHARYVNVSVNNGGAAQLHEFHWLDDGTMLQVMHQHQDGLPYAERTRSRIVGEAMTLSIDLLMPEGSSQQILDGTLTRTASVFEIDWDAKAWAGAIPATELQLLARSAGTYDVKGAMVMMPGAPEVAITGTDTFRSVFGDTIFHGHTRGAAEGVPGEYVGEVFWSFDAVRKCLVGVYVSNFGEVMSMDAWWADDGQLVSTFAGTMRGQPLAQRMRMSFDDKGRAKDAVSHTLMGTMAPFESFRATYTAK
ncbi:MAG: DUF1579 family protein [Planctomycetes bacterium]|nr:DUF1579 family protein [Planctomycetota bacterium]